MTEKKTEQQKPRKKYVGTVGYIVWQNGTVDASGLDPVLPDEPGPWKLVFVTAGAPRPRYPTEYAVHFYWKLVEGGK